MWYTSAQNTIERFSHPWFKHLAAEARKCETFEEFEHDFIADIKHGIYFHLTHDQNFFIDPNKGPKDMSSLSGGGVSIGNLMVTSDPEYWDNYYNWEDNPDYHYDEENDEDVYEYKRRSNEDPLYRPYAALINLDNVPRHTYRQINRGFGNEFFLFDTSQATVEEVLPALEALDKHDEYTRQLPQNTEELKQFYDMAKKGLI